RGLVLSRPQFLVSNLDVIAEINHLQPSEVTIRDVHWPSTEQARQLINQTIPVRNLADCVVDRLEGGSSRLQPLKDGRVGPGSYILPLVVERNGRYSVAPVPPSPGSPRLDTNEAKPRIYPDTPQARQQLVGIAKPKA